MNNKQSGFTLIEIAIVLLIVSIILGYTVAMAPRQQELKQFKKAKQEMSQIQQALYAFAQVNGHLPCPALAASNGFECRDNDVIVGNCDNVPPVNTNTCDIWFGAVPAKTLGLNGKYSTTGLLLDPWGEQYYYAVTNVDSAGGAVGGDFIIVNEMNAVTMAGLLPDLAVCNADTTLSGTVCDVASERIIEDAPAVIISRGKNKEISVLQTENDGADLVYISTTHSDNFDDLVKWISPNILYSKMIEAGQLP